jgi:hypothetical protein
MAKRYHERYQTTARNANGRSRRPSRKSLRDKDFYRSRGDRRWTFPNDLTGTGLFQLAIAQVVDFTADTFFALGE